MLPLTKKEKEVLKFIRDFINEKGFPPSIREVASFFNIAPKNAHKYINNLEKKGYIKKAKNISRGISISLPKVPLVSTVPAGVPDEINEISDESYQLDPDLFPYQNAILVKVFGDSMINAHIENGDIAVVAVNSEIKSGDIVVASVFNELTLKRYIEKSGKRILHPENENYEDIVLDEINSEEIKIIGKVVGIIRKMS